MDPAIRSILETRRLARPVTGWPAKPAEIRQWEKITHENWRRVAMA